MLIEQNIQHIILDNYKFEISKYEIKIHLQNDLQSEVNE